MAIFHKIRAWLYDNMLTPDPNDYSIRVIPDRTLTIRDICYFAESRGGSDITAAAMEHAVILFFGEMGYQLCDGYAVNTGWFTAGPHIKGIVKSPVEQYNKDKHTLLFEFHQGSLLRKELENVVVEIVGVADTDAVIAQIFDVKSGSVNNVITPNRNLKITGYKIKIAGDNVANGIYFAKQDTSERTKVDESDIVINNPSELIVVTPALAAGKYILEVITQYTPSNILKTPRTAIFDKILTILG
jgi:hypothetical protein